MIRDLSKNYVGFTMVKGLRFLFAFFSLSCSLLASWTTLATAQVPTDFNGDQISDLTSISIGNDSSLSWYYRDSQTGQVQSINAGGQTGNHIALAKWRGATDLPGILQS